METKAGMLFLASAAMPVGTRETAREFCDICWPLQDRYCDLHTNISAAYISALVQWMNNLHKKSLQKNIYFIWLYWFCVSAASFIARKAFTQLPKKKLRSTFPD